MLIFHGGLPRSGKSYEALARRIIPALQQGRHVVAYVEGLDHGKIAEVAGLERARVEELLHVVTREQMLRTETKAGKEVRVPLWIEQCRDNALHVFDEAQNFWGNRARLTDAEVELVSEHGHRGMDIVLMGQSYKDVNTLWRRRLEIRLEFVKLSALGTQGRYSVATHRHKGNDDWERVSTVVSSYDAKYFGTYKSHTDDSIQTGNYSEGRSTVYGSWLFKLALPLAIGGALLGSVYLWRFFHPEAPAAGAPLLVKGGAAQPAPVSSGPAVVVKAAPPVVEDHRSPLEKRFAGLSDKYRVRLAGIATGGKRTWGVVEWMDGGSRVIERFRFDDLRDLGVSLIVGDGFVRLSVGGWSDLATMWPVEADGRVSENRQAVIAGGRVAQAEPSPVATVASCLGGCGGTREDRERPGAVTEVPKRQN